MPNLLAHIALFGWPLAAIWIFKNKRITTAVILMFLIPYMWLPYGMRLDLPLIPPIDKWTLPAVMAFLILKLTDRSYKLLPESGFLTIIFVMTFVYPIFTTYTNGDVLNYAGTIRPAMSFADIISLTFTNFALIYVPLSIGAHYLPSEESHKTLISIIAVCGFIYSVFCLWEIRMSPQLHKDIYGFSAISWGQQIRNGGFRPVVFMGHGLYVAMFMSIAVMCSVLLAKRKAAFFSRYSVLKVGYIFGILILCKTWSAAIYAMLALTIIVFLNRKTWLNVASILAIIVFLYPMLRASNMIPVQQINDYFTELNADRGQSLGFRFDNEDVLLIKARERPLFGWGGWGRQRVYSEITGEDTTVTDGTWIIIFGQFGWLGYVAIFGALCGSVIIASRRLKKLQTPSFYTSGLVLIVSLNLVDLIPNSSLSPITYLMVGALIGASVRKQPRKNPPNSDQGNHNANISPQQA